MFHRREWALAAVVLLLGLPLTVQGAPTCPYSMPDCLHYFANEAPKRGWMGADLQPHEATGELLLTRIHPEGPAAAAGLKIGDVVVAVDGHSLADLDDSAKASLGAKMTPGGTHIYTVRRSETQLEVKITLVPIPEEELQRRTGAHFLLEHTEEEKASS